MKAAFFRSHGSKEVLEFGELPDPIPTDDEVLVKPRFSALNHLDIWVREGIPGLKLALPHVPGSDGAGTIIKIGAHVTQFKIGDEVIIHPGIACDQCKFCQSGEESLCSEYKILGEHLPGTMGEVVKVPVSNLFLKPKTLDFESAASFALVFTTAWHMLIRRAKIERGEKVLIHAAGSGVSLAALQIAKIFTDEIAVTSTSQAKLEKAKELGAKYLWQVTDGKFLPNIKATWKGGADIVVDHVGKAYWEQNIKGLRNGGRLVTCGATSGFDAETDLRHVFYRQIQILGSTMGSKLDFPKIISLMEKGTFRLVVDRCFPLERIQEAQAWLESQRQVGKVLLSHRN